MRCPQLEQANEISSKDMTVLPMGGPFSPEILNSQDRFPSGLELPVSVIFAINPSSRREKLARK
jgi:hypothetical protein